MDERKEREPIFRVSSLGGRMEKVSEVLSDGWVEDLMLTFKRQRAEINKLSDADLRVEVKSQLLRDIAKMEGLITKAIEIGEMPKELKEGKK